MTEPSDQSAGGQTLDVGALIHSGAGIVSLLVGGLMYFYSWATPVPGSCCYQRSAQSSFPGAVMPGFRGIGLPCFL